MYARALDALRGEWKGRGGKSLSLVIEVIDCVLSRQIGRQTGRHVGLRIQFLQIGILKSRFTARHGGWKSRQSSIRLPIYIYICVDVAR